MTEELGSSWATLAEPCAGKDASPPKGHFFLSCAKMLPGACRSHMETCLRAAGQATAESQAGLEPGLSSCQVCRTVLPALSPFQPLTVLERWFHDTNITQLRE